MKLKIIIAFMFTILLSVTFASNYLDYDLVVSVWGDGDAAPYGGNWFILSFLLLFASIACLTIISILAYSLDLYKLKMWIRGESVQMLLSAFMILFFVILIQAGTSYIGQYIGGQTIPCGTESVISSEPITFAKCNYNEKIDVLGQMYQTVYANNYGNERWMSQTISVMGIPVYSGSWSGQIRRKVGEAHTISARILPLLIGLWGQKAAIGFIQSTMLVLFLPIGLVLRIIPYTRGIGGLFIAMALGLYFIFPITLLMLNPAFERADMNRIVIYDYGKDAKACYVGFKGAVTMSTDMVSRTEDGMGTISYGIIADELSYMMFEVMFNPFIAFAVAVLFIKTLAPVLGSDGAQIIKFSSKL